MSIAVHTSVLCLFEAYLVQQSDINAATQCYKANGTATLHMASPLQLLLLLLLLATSTQTRFNRFTFQFCVPF
jgi:hypothetical protein